MRERLLSLQRYSSEYNLRFHNVPESTEEKCVQKVRNILSNQLDMEPKTRIVLVLEMMTNRE